VILYEPGAGRKIRGKTFHVLTDDAVKKLADNSIFGGCPSRQAGRPAQPTVGCILGKMANRKSVVLSLVLTFFLGPFGMLYSTVPGELIMLVLYVALGIVTFGWAIAVLHPIAMIWGAVAADRANR
jgi:hypothetical protein